MKIATKIVKKPKILQRLTGLNQSQFKKLSKHMKLLWKRSKKIVDKMTEFRRLELEENID